MRKFVSITKLFKKYLAISYLNVLVEVKIKFSKIIGTRKQTLEFASKLNILQKRLTDLIADSKQKYNTRMVNKLISTEKSIKVSWSLVRTFLNIGKYHSLHLYFKIMQYKTDFLEKAKLFNSFLLSNVFY